MPDVEFDVVPCYLGTGVDMLILGIIGSQFMYWALRREKEEWYIRSYMVRLGRAKRGGEGKQN